MRFWRSVKKRVQDGSVAKDFHLVVHHYLASAHAVASIPARARDAAEQHGVDWYPSVDYRFGATLPAQLPVSKDKEPEFLRILDNHYSPAIMTPSMKVGGEDGRLGFAACGLPIVLEHNTPNNTIAIIWAEQEKFDDHPEMRPLFRRRQRHL